MRWYRRSFKFAYKTGEDRRAIGMPSSAPNIHRNREKNQYSFIALKERNTKLTGWTTDRAPSNKRRRSCAIDGRRRLDYILRVVLRVNNCIGPVQEMKQARASRGFQTGSWWLHENINNC
ncbi:hypothetical protein GWI33_021147 [Rhynchophorus ferrugineus]|uniref:Uncharacterized protein n=1 Tax=Rhynchophorus ferrugineus TaxID=354439 RepID=A0A834HPM7_RHYFE|nr:hypothetical protein GWI33_021147 [Rhynchophorus ferrugineus]